MPSNYLQLDLSPYHNSPLIRGFVLSGTKMSLPPQIFLDLGPPRIRVRSHFAIPTHFFPELGRPLLFLFLSLPNSPPFPPWQKFCGPVLGHFVVTFPVHRCHWTGPTFMVAHHIRNLLTSTLNTEVERYSEKPVFADKTNLCYSPHYNNLYTHHQWRS
jgi:hypothetical protein